MRYYEDNINSNSYIEFSKNKSKANLKSEEVDNENKDSQSEDIDNIKQMGVPNMPQQAKKEIQCITIIGEIEGHYVGNPQKKSTIILNTVGGDVEAGLAMAELINSISKKVVTLVLGGSHSIGVPLATAGDYSFIAPTATMVVHPIRTNGLVIGVNETFEYFKKMQERITQFIIRTSNIERGELEKIMHSKEDLVSDVGSVLIGKEAVECGLINEVGGFKDAMNKLKELIKESNNK